jgi:putative molybdopterin biosynthesis protein
MSTREVADYLRIKERKVYDLVRARKIPCSRVTGKWLFPRDLVDRWVAQNTEFAETGPAAPPPPVAAGSHDPLLDWAVRESHCGLALMPGGSLDGLKRLAAGEATLAGMHVIDSETGAYNVPAIAQTLRGRDVVALTWAEREQGLVVAPGNPLGLEGVAGLRGRKIRLAVRQPEAGAQILLLHLLTEAGVKLSEISVLQRPALNESDLGLAVLEGKADAGLAVRAIAKRYRLDFVPLAKERFDLVMHRRDFFEAPVQKLLAFANSPAFRTRAAELGGYDVAQVGQVVYNA